MKEMFLFLFVFIPLLVKGIVITPVIVGKSELINLNTTIGEPTYFYMYVHKEKYGPLYFLLSDSNYTIDVIEGFLSKVPPNATVIEGNKDKFSKIHYKQKKDMETSIDYFYNFTISGDDYGVDKYVIIHYTGKNSNGTLKARSSFEDLYILTTAKLTSLHIVLIIAGGLIFIGILTTGLVCVFKKKKKSEERVSNISAPLVRDTVASAASAKLITIN